MKDKIRILLVDDQVLFIESLKSVIETAAPDIQVMGIAYNGLEAIDFVANNYPEIILLDVRMPIMDGVEAVKIIHEKYPDIKVMMLTTFDDDEYVHEALKYGAAGYMLKDVPPENLIDSIRAIKTGTIQISPKIMVKLMDFTGEAFPLDLKQKKDLVKNLSKREQEILYLLSEGYDNPLIAEKLFIAEQTVKNHIHNIYTKLSVHDRTSAVKMAKAIHLGNSFNHLK